MGLDLLANSGLLSDWNGGGEWNVLVPRARAMGRTQVGTGPLHPYTALFRPRWERKDDDVFTLKVRPGETPGATFWFKEKGDVSTAGKSDLVFITQQV